MFRLNLNGWFCQLLETDLCAARAPSAQAHEAHGGDMRGLASHRDRISAERPAEARLRPYLPRMGHRLGKYRSRECFWAWHSHVRLMYPGLFRALDGSILTGIARNGRWVYRGG